MQKVIAAVAAVVTMGRWQMEGITGSQMPQNMESAK